MLTTIWIGLLGALLMFAGDMLLYVPWRPSEEGHTQRYIRQKPGKINKYRAMQQPTVTCRYRVGSFFS